MRRYIIVGTNVLCLFVFICFDLIFFDMFSLSSLIWIAQTPFGIGTRWTNKAGQVCGMNLKESHHIYYLCGFCFGCGFCFSSADHEMLIRNYAERASHGNDDDDDTRDIIPKKEYNFGYWTIIVYRFIISIFLSILIAVSFYNNSSMYSNNYLYPFIEPLIILEIVLIPIVTYTLEKWRLHNKMFVYSPVTIDSSREAMILIKNGMSTEMKHLDMFGVNLTKNISSKHLSKGISKEQGKDTAVLFAARKNDVESLKVLLKQGANFNVTDWRGHTPLLVAASYSHYNVINFLLSQNPPIKYLGDTGDRPLMLLTSGVDVLKVMKLLLNKYYMYIDVNGQNKVGITPLMEYIKRRGRGYPDELILEMIQLLLKPSDNSKIDLEIRCNKGYTAVMYAVQIGHIEILKMLHNYGADFNKKRIINDSNKWNTLLSMACDDKQVNKVCNKLSVVKYLIEEVKCNYINENVDDIGNKAIIVTAGSNLNDKLEIIKYFVNSQDLDGKNDNNQSIIYSKNNLNQSCVFMAAKYNNLDVLKYFLENYHFDINETDIDGNTPFMASCENGSLETMKYFSENFSDMIDINQWNSNGETALTLVKQSNNSTAVKLLQSFNKITQLDPGDTDKREVK